MKTFSKENIITSIKNKDVIILKDFYQNTPKWSDINNLYDDAKHTEDIQYVSFATMAIRNASQYTKVYDDLIKIVSEMHNDQCLGAMSIIHFISRVSNIIKDQDAITLKEKFNLDNTNEWPNHVTITDDGVFPPENFEPTIHSDAADGFFVQCDGETLWRIYDDNDNLRYTHTIKTGDLLYIPKNVRHSVDSLCPRHSVSIAFPGYKID